LGWNGPRHRMCQRCKRRRGTPRASRRTAARSHKLLMAQGLLFSEARISRSSFADVTIFYLKHALRLSEELRRRRRRHARQARIIATAPPAAFILRSPQLVSIRGTAIYRVLISSSCWGRRCYCTIRRRLSVSNDDKDACQEEQDRER
jgi:hypothetical protein